MLSVYLAQFFSFLALSSFLPFYSVWLSAIHFFSVGNIALLVGIFILSNRLFSIFIAPFMKKYHKKNITIFTMTIGILCSILIYMASQFKSDSMTYWCFLSFLFGSAFSMNTLCLLTILTNTIEQEHHITVFSHLRIATNLSAALGPFLGGLTIHYLRNFYSLVPALFLVIAIIFSFRLPLDKIKDTSPIQFTQLVKIGSRKMLLLLALNFLILIAYAQFYQVFPLLAKNFISSNWIGILFLINGLTIVALQIPVTNLMRKKPYFYLIICHILFLIGLLLLPLISSKIFVLVILAIVFISIAEIIFAPIYRSLCIKWNPNISSEIAFSKLNLMWGAGNSLGAYIGLYWIGHKYFTSPFLLGAAALLLGIILLFWNRKAF